MKRLFRTVLAWAGVVCLGAASARAAEPAIGSIPPAASRTIDFNHDIKPLFEASCVSCHGKGKEKGGFNLETRAAFLKGGDSGPAAVIGKSGESLVVKLVAGVDPDNVMPMNGTKWTAEQVAMLRAWIDQGMKWDDAVTFARPEPANLKRQAVALPAGNGEEHPIDRILAGYFASKNMATPPPVEDRVFARRAYLDVWGLTPTPEQLEAFLNDASGGKRQWLVRQLLTDRRKYAEHWLTFWNDLLRNDYRGTGFIDGGRRQISGWLYSALVNNLPYDRFVAELVNPSKASEGFARGIIWRGEVNASMLPPMQAAQNVSQVFMGINLKCASCHDSFINDWTLADAYGLAAVYSDDTLELVLCDKPTGKTAHAKFLYSQVGSLDGSLPKEQRMAQLSRLMTSKENGRLSRTVVNRLWARLIGRGLVEPVDDMDQKAWNGELLDYLAEDLVAHNYDLKRTIELILTSKAYALPTVEGPKAKEEYIFRGPLTRRLTAEQFADAVSSFTNEWSRMPNTLDFDFTAGSLVSVKTPKFIWNDEPVELGNERAYAQGVARAEAANEKRKADEEKKRIEAEEKRKAEGKASPTEKGGAPAKDATKPDVTAKSEESVKPEVKEGEAKSDKPEPAKVESAKSDAPAKKDDDKDSKEKDAKPGDEKKVDQKKPEEKKELAPPVVPPAVRHRVGFRRSFTLAKVPDEAFATMLATQSFALSVNGRPVGPTLSDGQRMGRIQLFDLKPHLKAGLNVVTLDVSSHTEKSLNDTELPLYPKSRNHLNANSGVAFYLNATMDDASRFQLVTDEKWQTCRSPDDGWKEMNFNEEQWRDAVVLADGVRPVDEGPALQPQRRKDFANEPLDVSLSVRSAISTAAQPGGIRAPMLASDPLMTALDRPNREQVTTVRLAAATTLQALELTNGSAMDNRLKRAGGKLLLEVAKDPAAWVERTYRQALSRDPSDKEREVALETIGQPVSAEGIADFLWAITMLPEFQLID